MRIIVCLLVLMLTIAPICGATNNVQKDMEMWQNQFKKELTRQDKIDVDGAIEKSRGLGRNEKIVMYRTVLESYIDTGFDLLGQRGEQIFFKLRDDYAKGNWFRKIEFEKKTMDLQVKMAQKCFSENGGIYVGLLGLRGVKGYYNGLNKGQQKIIKSRMMKGIKVR